MTVLYEGGDILKILDYQDSRNDIMLEQLLDYISECDQSYILTKEYVEDKTKREINKIIDYMNIHSIDILTNDRVDKEYDYYNGYFVNEFGEPIPYSSRDYSYGLYDFQDYKYNQGIEFLYSRCDLKHCYYILSHIYDIYRCDNCNQKYITYRNQLYAYANQSASKLSSILGHSDLCYQCYKRLVEDNRKKNGRKIIERLYESGKVPASKPQRYINNLFKGELNKPVGRYFVDSLIDDHIVLEYDGSGHWLSSVFRGKSLEEINANDSVRDEYLISQGYKVFRIVSKEDLLPSDEYLVELLEVAKKHFSSGASKFVFEIKRENFGENDLRKIE